MSFSTFIDQSAHLESVFDIDEHLIKKHEIKGLVFDLDGVLVAHDELMPQESIRTFLNSLHQSGLLLAIHSNNDFPDRTKYLKKEFPFIEVMPAQPKKPNPSHLLYLSQKWKIKLAEVAMVDDRCWTGGAAAYKAQTKFFWIIDPMMNFSHAPLKELWFYVLRKWEKAIISLQIKREKRTREDSNL